jgi:hypothetical protein
MKLLRKVRRINEKKKGDKGLRGNPNTLPFKANECS